MQVSSTLPALCGALLGWGGWSYVGPGGWRPPASAAGDPLSLAAGGLSRSLDRQKVPLLVCRCQREAVAGTSAVGAARGCGQGAAGTAGQGWVLLLLSIPVRRARAASKCRALLVLPFFSFLSLDLKHVVSGWS